MPKRRLVLKDAPAQLVDGLSELIDHLEIPTNYRDDVLAAAEQAAATGPGQDAARVDRTDLPLVTIDPAGSLDLDQALFIERAGDGYRVWYAIADVASWVTPGGALDADTRRRGQTYYAPNQRFGLHPPRLSEDAASLLADGRARPAWLWQIDLDASGQVATSRVEKALVKSVAKLDYAGVQRDLDAGTASESLQLLRTVGKLREQVEVARGGVSLNLPEQEIVANGSRWSLEFRRLLAVENWNAQISLLTGICAAELMLQAGVGILRTLPPAQPRDVAKLHRIAKLLHISWPQEMGYPDFVRSLDTSNPEHLAMMNACTLLFRGAGYTVIDPSDDDQVRVHAALATPYAHVTAPLRRLVDRFAEQICVDISAGREPAEWAIAALPELPEQMRESDRRAKAFERGCVDLVEALVLDGHEGQDFTGTIIDLDERNPNRGFASIPLVAVEAAVHGNGLDLGERQPLRLKSVDVRTGRVVFVLDEH